MKLSNMATLAQVKFIRAHLFVDQALIKKLTTKEASDTIDAIRSVYNTLPPAERHTGMLRVSKQFEDKVSSNICDSCGGYKSTGTPLCHCD